MAEQSAFVPAEFEPPRELGGERFVLEPLGPQHNRSDYDAWTSSMAHISSTPGFENSSWPHEMTADENRADLEGHARDFEQRRGFTFTVLEPGSRVVIGCVYIYPSDQPQHDADVRSWVRASHADLDEPLRRCVAEWLARDWPFRSPHVPGVVAITARHQLRLLRRQDAGPLQRLYGDAEAMRFVGSDGMPRTADQTEAGVALLIEHQRRHGFSLWAVVDRESGEVIGVAGLVLVELIGPEVEVVYELVREHWGKGIATEVGRACLDVAFGQLGLRQVVALSYPENEPSVRVMQKIGMTADGEFEAYGRRMVRYVADAPDA
jgi:RimJ/RimL family protein N-acetyltransferase